MPTDQQRGSTPASQGTSQDAVGTGGRFSRRRPRVLIADDHVPTRSGIKRILEHSGFEVCAEVANAEAAVEAAIRERADIALLDIHMPGNGIAAAAEIHGLVPETAVVILTVSRDKDDVSDSLRAGARAYLLKDMDPLLIPPALEAVLRGEVRVPNLPEK